MLGQLRKLVRLLTAAKERATFAAFLYKNANGEVSHVTLILGADNANVYAKDVEILKSLIPTLSGIDLTAGLDILKSREKSLAVGLGNNPRYTLAGYYWTPKALLGTGLRVHKGTGAIQVMGLAHAKTVIVPGEYPNVNSKPLTIAKRGIEKQLPSSRIRSYDLAHVAGIRMNGTTIEFDNVI